VVKVLLFQLEQWQYHALRKEEHSRQQ